MDKKSCISLSDLAGSIQIIPTDRNGL